MSTSIPLSILVAQILARTPPWVWGILVMLVVLGLVQLREQVASGARLTIMPVALGGLSLWGAVSAFGAQAAVIAPWLAGMGIAFALNAALRWPRRVQRRGNGFVVPGSVWPLVLMMAIFMLRYVVNVALVLNPAGAHGAAFVLPMSMLYGALSGLFAARAWRIVGGSRMPALAAA